MSAFENDCLPGSKRMRETFPGAEPVTPMRFWSRRSCSSKPRWTACFPITCGFWSDFQPSNPSPPPHRRAVNLQRTARTVVEERGGAFPEDPAELKKLPGIGAYTAGAIAAFAYERDVAFLDTNMRRVVSRVFFGSESARESDAIDAATALLPPGHGWAWNQALIEFGALQCTARRPACIICPLQLECRAYPTMQVALQLKSSRSNRAKTEPFESTTRYYRGRIVEALRALPADELEGIPLPELGLRVREDFTSENLPWLRDLVDGLQRDGLARVAEDPPPYDADRESAAGLRVRLP